MNKRAEFEAWIARVKPAYWQVEAWRTEAWAMWQSICVTLAQQQVPHGWRLVPVEPTWDMQMAASSNYREPRDGHYTARMECAADAYRAMLAAAPPSPPAEQQGSSEAALCPNGEPWDPNPDGIKPGQQSSGPRMDQHTGLWDVPEADDAPAEQPRQTVGLTPLTKLQAEMILGYGLDNLSAEDRERLMERAQRRWERAHALGIPALKEQS